MRRNKGALSTVFPFEVRLNDLALTPFWAPTMGWVDMYRILSHEHVEGEVIEVADK